MNQSLENNREKDSQRTKEMRIYYKDECRKWQEAKKERQEAFEFCKSRQGDNSQAVKMRNK